MCSRQFRHADALILQGQQSVSLGLQCVPFGAQRECMDMLLGYKCCDEAHSWNDGDPESKAKGRPG